MAEMNVIDTAVKEHQDIRQRQGQRIADRFRDNTGLELESYDIFWDDIRRLFYVRADAIPNSTIFIEYDNRLYISHDKVSHFPIELRNLFTLGTYCKEYNIKAIR